MLEIQAFGPVDFLTDDGDLDPVLRQPKRLALLLYLVLARPQRFQRRDVLLALFWPELDEFHARKALSQSLSYLRRHLPDSVLLTRGNDEVGVDLARLRCDVLAFEEALEERRWAAAVDLYRGELLEGLHVADAPGFQDWLDRERERLRERAAGAAWSLARQQIDAGELVLAERSGQLAVRLVPTDESPVRDFIRRLAHAGDRAASLNFYHRYAAILAEGLEVEPAPETAAVMEAIRAGSGPTPATVEGEAGRPPDPTEAGHPAGAAKTGESPQAAPPRRAAAPAEPTASTEPVMAGRRALRPALIAAALVVALGAVVALLPTARAPDTVPSRVAVLPFENRTGQESLDAVGALAADWITAGVARLDSVQAVPMPTVLAALADSGAGVDRPRWIARSTGAGLVVRGPVTDAGDSLEFRSELVDPVEGTILRVFDPVRAPRSDPTRALGAVRQQIMGTIALRFNTLVDRMATIAMAPPPSYDAYRAYLAGINLFTTGRFAAAVSELDRAWAADSSFAAPGIWIASAYWNLGQPAREDSILQRLEARRATLAPYEREPLDVLAAQLRGDNAEVYRLARDGYRRLPSTEGRYITGTFALRTNRLEEAARVLGGMENELIRGRSLGFHRSLTLALHYSRQYRQELDAAREARRRFPDELEAVLWEARALVGLDRIDDAVATVDRGLTLAPRSWSPGFLLLQAGLELRFHGHPRLAERTLRRGLDWYRSAAGSTDLRYSMARALLWLDRADSALVVFRDLAAEDPASLDRLGYLGLTAAAAGEVGEARSADQRLAAWSEPYVRGRHLYWRATIAARLGEKARATALLRDAVSQGVYYDLLHENEELRPLWDFPAFQELLEPIG